MKGTAIATRAGLCVVLLLGGTIATACGSNERPSEVRRAGTVIIPLETTVSADTYRLDAIFVISDAQGAITTLTTNGSEPFLSTTLAAGPYSAFLQSFTLSKDDGTGTFNAVSATVESSTEAFTVFAGSTTTVSFQFDTQTASSGSGDVNITFEVTKSTPACTPFSPGCPDEFWCAPPALTGAPAACLLGGTTPVGAPCGSPLECMVQATCHDFGAGPICAALCAPEEFGNPCASGGICNAADPSYGICASAGSVPQILFALDGQDLGFFGEATAVLGDTAVVGAPSMSGLHSAVYVYSRSDGPWVLQQRLDNPSGGFTQNFGQAIALSERTAFIGNPVGANLDGLVHVFARTGSTWVQTEVLPAPDAGGQGRFGSALAISGDTLLVGAYTTTIGSNYYEGAAYVLQRQGSQWIPQARLTPSDGARNEWFGYSVALDSDTALVGAYLGDPLPDGAAGTAYVFRRSGSSWTQEAKLVASDATSGISFGNAVALSGDWALVGAPGHPRPGTPPDNGQGLVYVFRRSGETWTEVQTLIPTQPVPRAAFGFSLTLFGSDVLIGAPTEQQPLASSEGAAYLFQREGATWEQTRRFSATGTNHDGFGFSVALSADTALIGVPGADVGSNDAQGQAFSFER